MIVVGAQAVELVAPHALGSAFGPGSPLERAFLTALAERAPLLEVVPATGSPLDGSVLLASGDAGIYADLVELVTRSEGTTA